ncbi:alpha/beta fold hydrolase [Pendulispora rubella]|uniref:Alpha/beta fold hydrolase n=1 Tax=Pendulispora rubella TaxID=2741070 RepID=A0ABZ2L0I7_9BACT
MSLSGHYWTIAPFVSHVARRTPAPAGAAAVEPWSAVVAKDAFGDIRLLGELRRASHRSPRPRALLVVIHGLGGSSASHYMRPATRAAHDVDIASLCLNLRGVGGGAAEDFYHAGLWQDVDAALASASLAEYTDIYIFGYSMGGHVALRYATEQLDPRVRAVAAVCSPLDLDRSAATIDRPARWIYRHHVLRGLKRMVAPVVRRKKIPISITEMLSISTLRTWDRRIVAPHHGFDSAEDYYAKASVAPRLARLERPALLVASPADPMVESTTVRPALEHAPARLDVRWASRGGHVGFPRSLDLGERGPLGLEHQVLAWLLRQGP